MHLTQFWRYKMKYLLIIIQVIIALQVSGQLASDRYGLPIGDEYLQQLILNQIKNNNNQFKIKITSGKSTKLKCHFDYKDSILCQKCREQKIKFKIQNGKFEWFPNSKDSLNYDLKSFFEVQSDSANTIIIERFHIENNDTILIYNSNTQFDSLNRPMEIISNLYLYNKEVKTNFIYTENQIEKNEFERSEGSKNWELIQTVTTTILQNKTTIHELNFDFWITDMTITFDYKNDLIESMNVVYFDAKSAYEEINLIVK